MLSFFKKAGLVCLGLAVFAIIVLSITIFRITHSKDFPDIETITTYIPSETTKIYSDDGIVLAELHKEENRELVPLEKISPILQKSVVALEDTDFYKHHGINLKGILRALYKDIKARRFVEGGSTLTQQLARNLFLTKQKKITRKLAEMVLAIQIERRYTKPEILEMYLNQVYWGHNAYGIQSASEMYFGKNAEELSLAEAALMVGMLKGPELFSPFRNYPAAKRRQNVVLNRMARVGLISEDQIPRIYDQELEFKTRKKLRYKAPYFTQFVVQQLIDMYGEDATYTSGMKVYTTLNYKYQKKAEEVVEKYIKYGKQSMWIKGEKVPSLNYSQGSILAIDPATGYIKAMEGGYDFLENQFNHCTQARRQPGSAFKPFVYLAALEKGLSPGTILDDSPVTFNTIEGPYAPQNYTHKFLGPLPMRKALENSINVIAIKLNHLVGPKNVVKVAKKIGIESHLLPILSLPLGANEVTMLELVSAYGVFANNGRRVEPCSIIKIVDRDGTILFQNRISEKKVFDPNLIACLVEMMRGVVKYGTGRNANLPRPVAGKTGTTSDYRDAWFFGFVPQLVCAAWVGNDDNTPMQSITGGWVPALMWKDFMTDALKDIRAYDFRKPTGLVQMKINWKTGKLANHYTPEECTSVEKYWRGSEPTEEDGPDAQFTGDKSQPGEHDSSILDFFRM
ncbi:transglycosylase domain-containing protein [Thermoproteota archaeon]